ncbi:thiamine transport system ATP-binding protein [Actinopolyspora biskrensis]|uniref:ABC-type quaternary amine transporter n=1 Tax=Actinopolyspora biskrensis TaxID=1470178 RepID=A0A852YYF9_9ACTN|nr:ABC transporter ATP-binding protein [Actinopolyspora biskrensis]NYH80124.1 thiamine transport system ATP-binding protein [Actinopolyspora biskrensis]
MRAFEVDDVAVPGVRQRDEGLRLENVTVRYGSTTALSGIDLSAPGGEVLAVLGPSGGGKSTLLRTVAGLEGASRGAVRFGGEDLSGVPVHRRGFGMVFQDGQLFGHRDVAGNVEFGLRMRSVGRRERSREVARLLELVGLAGYQRRRVSELSGGQAQRVALARALAARPRLLLLDEPLSGLDRMLRERLAVDLAELLADSATTAVVVTHDLDEAFTLADRVAVLSEGRVLQEERPRRLWTRPADEEVAGFLGCTTFLRGRIEDGVASCPLGSVPCPGEHAGEVLLGLRATGVRAHRSGTERHPGRRGEVVRRLHRHDHVRLTVAVPELAGAELLEAVVADTDVPDPGEDVALALDPAGVALLGR